MGSMDATHCIRRQLPLFVAATLGLGITLGASSGCNKLRSKKGTKASTSTSPHNPSAPGPKSPLAIRDNSSSTAAKDGVIVDARLLISKFTPKDRLGIALRLRPDTPGKPHPWTGETLAFKDSTLRFEFTTPDEKKVSVELESTPTPGALLYLSSWQPTYHLDGSGTTAASWKTPVPELLAKPGKYSVAFSAELKTNKRTLSLSSKPLSFEIVAGGDSFKTLAEIETTAAKLVEKELGLSAAPKPNAAVIDDEKDNRWLRFRISEPNPGYHARFVEVQLDPSGKELLVDQFRHFTCVARGTPIATPKGAVPIQELQVGDAVISFDPKANARSVSHVQRTDSAHADELLAFGELLVTERHPIYANGSWQLARDVPPGAKLLLRSGSTAAAHPVRLTLPTTVYDISVSPPHTYFAGGVLVHNKAVYEPLGGRSRWGESFFRRAAKK